MGSLYVLLLFLSLSYSQIRMINIRLIDTYHCMDGEKSGNFTYTDANLHKTSVNQHGAILQNDTLIVNPSFQYRKYIHGNPQHRITKKTNPRCRFSYPREKKKKKRERFSKIARALPKVPRSVSSGCGSDIAVSSCWRCSVAGKLSPVTQKSAFEADITASSGPEAIIHVR